MTELVAALERIAAACAERREELPPGKHQGDLALLQMIAEIALAHGGHSKVGRLLDRARAEAAETALQFEQDAHANTQRAADARVEELEALLEGLKAPRFRRTRGA